ncbi:hypothetical protein ODZ84_09870 [Chryseobacterium fluminis]|uniref:hypothetical protein n=1 Tax=Chryseobacterium fluminis TaxID=2983606 RepID=UPI00224FD3C4|nr:hypothetical protein [Chryseobacterium sp. MMS21-Ot14]UZT99840.1 hypothetical protein ODZ84_09870 [Chryseobacterium sp. MMS21-Ot14]
MNYKENMDAGRFANFKSVSATFSLLDGDGKNPFSHVDFTKFGADEIEGYGGGSSTSSTEQNCCPDGEDPSLWRKSWNFIADNVISKPVEGVQVVGYLFYGTGLALVDIVKTGEAGDKHIKMDMTLWGFQNGSLGKTLNYKDGTTIMSEKEKFKKIAIPGIETMTMGIGFRFKPFQSAIANWGVNTAVKTGVKKGIYQLGPK